MKKIDIIFLFCFFWLSILTCCKSKQCVLNDSKITSVNDVLRDKVNVSVNDSVYVEDKQLILQRNDTIYVYRDIYRNKIRNKDTTIIKEKYITEVDTIFIHSNSSRNCLSAHGFRLKKIIFLISCLLILILSVKYVNSLHK